MAKVKGDKTADRSAITGRVIKMKVKKSKREKEVCSSILYCVPRGARLPSPLVQPPSDKS